MRLLLRRLRNFFVAIGNGMLPAYAKVARRARRKAEAAGDYFSQA